MAANDMPLVKFETHGNATLGTIEDSTVLNARQVADFGNFVVRYVGAHPGVNILLNFENVDHLSSSAITELIRIKDAVQAADGMLSLCGLSDSILQVFEITNMLDFLHVHKHDSADVALKKFQRAIDIAKEDKDWGNSG